MRPDGPLPSSAALSSRRMGTRSLKTITAAARALKSYVDEADKNRDGVISANELKRAGYSSGARGQFAKASLSMFAATAKGAPSTSTAELKKTIDTTVKELAAKDLDKDGFLEPGREETALRRSKRLAALYDFAPKSAVEGFGGYGRGESLLSLLSHVTRKTETTFTSAAKVPASVKPFVLQATGTTTLAEAMRVAGGNLTVRRFTDLRTDEAHVLVTWNGDAAGALYAVRRKEQTARVMGSVLQPV